MRKKQVLALLMTICLTLSCVPVFASGTDVNVTSGLGEGVDTIESMEELGEGTDEKENGEVDEEENEVLGDEPSVSPAAEQDTKETPTETPTETPAATPSETPAEEKDTVFYGEKGYASLEEAISENKEAKSLDLVLSGNQTISKTLVIPEGMTVTITAKEAASIVRSAEATGASVKVSKNAVLKLTQDKDGGAITVTGVEKADSPLFEVEGTLEIGAGVTVKDNHSSKTAGAVSNKGTLKVAGTITGNTCDAAGAVYSEGTLEVSGTAKITGNYKADKKTKSNIVLAEKAVLTVSGKLTEGAAVGVQSAKPSDGLTIVKAGSGVTLGDSLSYLTYDNSDYTIDEKGALKAKKTEPTDKTAPVLTLGFVERISNDIAIVTFTSDEDGTYYVSLDDANVDTSGSGKKMTANAEMEYQLEGLTKGEHIFYIVGKDAAGNVSNKLKITIPDKTEEVQIADPADNMINGIASSYSRNYYDSANKIYKYFVSFSATGAGMDYEDVEGNIRYEPKTWSISGLKNQSFREGYKASFSGDVDPGTYTLEVLFEQQMFNGEEWVATGQTDTKSADIVLKDAGGTNNKTNTSSNKKSSTYSGSSSSSKSKSSTSASSVKTGDTTDVKPVLFLGGSAAALAAATVLLKKRREEQE